MRRARSCTVSGYVNVVDFTASAIHVNTCDMPPHPRRIAYHHGNAAEAILVAAAALIDEKGVAAFSLREAARRVGIDPSACYRHFRDRDDLLHTLGRRGFTRLAERMERALARPTTPGQALRALARIYVDSARERPAEFRVMFGPTGVGARDPRLRGDYARGPFDILVATVRVWRGGTRPDDERVAMVLWAAAHGVASLVVDGAWRIDDRALEAILADLFDRLLAGPTPRTRSSARRS